MPSHHHSPPQIASRQTRLRRRLAAVGAGSALITDPINVRYLTGFTGDSSFLYLDPRSTVLISDTRFETQIAQECPGCEVEIRDARQTTEALAASVVQRAKPASLAIEADSLTKARYDDLAAELKSTSLIQTQGLVRELRAIKDRSELQLIRRSIKVAERAFTAVTAGLMGDQTERQVAFELEQQIRRLGGSGCSFEPIVAVGPQAALPHARPGAATLGSAPFTLFDWGAVWAGYASDLTRVLVTGKIPPKFPQVYATVLRAQQAAIDRIRPGVAVADVDAAGRSVIEAAGFGKYFGHALGHGFGLEIHELPRLSPIGAGTLEPGMVVTVEPGIYLPGWGGVRIEDDLLVTPDGHELLSGLPRDWESHCVECN